MKKISYKKNPKIKNDISSLYISAFPSNERPPLDWLYRVVNQYDENDIFGYYEKDEYIGFAYLTAYKDIVYVVYLAIDKKQRNKGYGTLILNDIKLSYPNHTILLCFEEVNSKYEDNDLRIKRQQFYIDNGFVNNGFLSKEGEVVYQSAYNGKRRVSFKEYQNIFDICYGEGASEKYLKCVREDYAE